MDNEEIEEYKKINFEESNLCKDIINEINKNDYQLNNKECGNLVEVMLTSISIFLSVKNYEMKNKKVAIIINDKNKNFMLGFYKEYSKTKNYNFKFSLDENDFKNSVNYYIEDNNKTFLVYFRYVLCHLHNVVLTNDDIIIDILRIVANCIKNENKFKVIININDLIDIYMYNIIKIHVNIELKKTIDSMISLSLEIQ